MRHRRTTLVMVLGASVLFVGGAERDTSPARKRVALGTARPAGGTQSDAPGLVGRDLTGAVRTYRNGLGQTVYSIPASRFDVSPPLAELATRARRRATATRETEPEGDEELPGWAGIRSGTPDPVVQSEIPPAAVRATGGPRFAPPAIGFNFDGASAGLAPSDANGAAGNDQFVEATNAGYQVWSLDRASGTPTSILGPVPLDSLWLGFGACETEGGGDPVVRFDQMANRWLISQMTYRSPPTAPYYECVALSTTADATGSYARWAFPLPQDTRTGVYLFGDYPHYGVWTDAYYVTATAVVLQGPPYRAGVFAAMDRPAMLAGSASATWQLILLPKMGHMPADVDGFAPPPTAAPGIFLSLQDGAMRIDRMKVDFTNPARTTLTEQARVPIAPATGACTDGGNGNCIPQPGVRSGLSARGDRLMFRAAYRNSIDHESLVVSHSVDPSVPGVFSGVRWYELRLSGDADSTCPAHPCVRQQGTIADVANGRSRWMPSVAMDGAGDILAGYSVSGLVDGSDNHSIRYTGRALADPLGVMTVPETVLATGVYNNESPGSEGRWGDYTSMAIDPADDCTFWYVNQYYGTSATRWSTRIASVRWPQGRGPGECPATSCTARPAAAPTIGPATAPGDNQIALIWTGISPTPAAYAIERAVGACGSEGLYRPLAAVSGSATSYLDATVQGGFRYAYRVIAAADPAGKCQGLVASGCVDALASGRCNLKPTFSGIASAHSDGSTNCSIRLGWQPGASSCPLAPALRYDVYRGTVPDFVPSPGNRIAACISGSTSYDDGAVTGGVTYYYVVHAEDASTGQGGACDGNEETNTITVHATAYGTGTQMTPATWTDGGGDATSLIELNVADPANTPDAAWRIVTAAIDPGANHTPAGGYAYRNAGPLAGDRYAGYVCAEMRTPPLRVGAAAMTLQYWERHQLEQGYDGVAVEYATNGAGGWTSVPAPSDSLAEGCASSDATGDWGLLNCAASRPNACSYESSYRLYNGPATTSLCEFTGAPSTYAHRCHALAGLTPGDTIQFRWRFASTFFTGLAGFYLDDIAVTSVLLPGVCAGCGPVPPSVGDTLAMVRRGADPVAYWGSAAEAISYIVEVAPGARFSIIDRTLIAGDGATGTPDPGAVPPPPGLLFYRARGVNACGTPGP